VLYFLKDLGILLTESRAAALRTKLLLGAIRRNGIVLVLRNVFDEPLKTGQFIVFWFKEKI
jgi:hypothetical protein